MDIFDYGTPRGVDPISLEIWDLIIENYHKYRIMDMHYSGLSIEDIYEIVKPIIIHINKDELLENIYNIIIENDPKEKSNKQKKEARDRYKSFLSSLHPQPQDRYRPCMQWKNYNGALFARYEARRQSYTLLLGNECRGIGKRQAIQQDSRYNTIQRRLENRFPKTRLGSRT